MKSSTSDGVAFAKVAILCKRNTSIPANKTREIPNRKVVIREITLFVSMIP